MERRILLLVLVLISTYATASSSRHMEDFIRLVKQVEDQAPGSKPVSVLRVLRRAAGLNDAYIQVFLGDVDSGAPKNSSDLSASISRAVQHRVTGASTEEGVVLTPDGTTVALPPLLLGLEAGFRSRIKGSVRGLFQLTLLKDLHEFQLQRSPRGPILGPDGCWDNITSPQVFTLMDQPALLTTAQVNGGMDGVVLGTEMADRSRRPAKLSDLLTEYYGHQLERGGMDAAPRLISRRRRENFRALANAPLLSKQAVRAVELRRSLTGRSSMGVKERRQLSAAVREGIRELLQEFIACPPIIPRCMWGAEPYRGTPTNLSLPLSYLFIHHTVTPGQPCVSFEQCSEDMRSMQRFHQDVRGWDDIGYSFVAGSDGHIYEGRGWHWQGAHTLGHNSIGYGVSFIGDYTSSLPSQRSMELVRDQLASCAVGGGRLKADYALQGHRQVVATACPGDALYGEIRGWAYFKEVEK